MNNDLLPEYQKYLRAKSLVQEKYITYYAHWASKFLSFSNRNMDLNHDLQVQKYLDDLKRHDNAADWQIRQAHDAIRLYFNHFKAGSFKNSNQVNMKGKYLPDDINGLVDKVRQAIRIRHYSYRTEHTYIHWIKRFLNYIKDVKTRDAAVLESADVKNYLSYLALKKKVSATGVKASIYIKALFI